MPGTLCLFSKQSKLPEPAKAKFGGLPTPPVLLACTEKVSEFLKTVNQRQI
jgi:hypothetical protein